MANNKENKEKEITGGELTDLPNDQYKKFFEKFEEISSLQVEEWKPVHILAYFCKKYQEQYETKYQFKFNSPSPTKCFEVFQVKKLAMLLSSNPSILKDYIDWIYANKVVKAKRKLTSISFMTHDGTVNEYKFNVLLAGKNNLNISRSSLLPEKYQALLQEIGISIKTYGDLSFVSQMEPVPSRLSEALEKMEALGFDKDILTRIV